MSEVNPVNYYAKKPRNELEENISRLRDELMLGIKNKQTDTPEWISSAELYKKLTQKSKLPTTIPNVKADLSEIGSNFKKFGYELFTDPSKPLKDLVNMIGTGIYAATPEYLQKKYIENYPEKGLKVEQTVDSWKKSLFGDQASNQMGILTPEGAAQRFYEKPVTSLFDASMVLPSVGLPLQLIDKTSKAGDAVMAGSNFLDPSKIVRTGPQMKMKSLKAEAELKKQQNADKINVAQKATNAGLKITPSTAPFATGFQKARDWFGKTNTLAKAQNQVQSNALIRKYMNVPENTALKDIYGIVQKRSGAAYEKLKNIKKVEVEVPVTRDVTSSLLGPNGKPIISKVDGVEKQIVFRSGADVLDDFQQQKIKTNKTFKNARNQNSDVTFDEAFAELDKLEKLQDEMQRIVNNTGDKNLINEFNAARKDYAKAHSVDAALVGGDINTKLLAAQKKKGTKLTDEADLLADFAEYYGDVSGLPKTTTSKLDDFVNVTVGVGLGAKVLAAKEAAMSLLPRSLLSKGTQAKMANPDFMPSYSGLLDVLSNRATTQLPLYIPTLLENTEIRNQEYL